MTGNWIIRIPSNKYHIISSKSTGGFSDKIFVVKHTHSNELRILKLMKQHVGNSNTFLTERYVLKLLNETQSVHFPKYYGSGEFNYNNNFYYGFMVELFDGKDVRDTFLDNEEYKLAEKIKKGCISNTTLLDLSKQLFEACKDLHKLQIAHRDIKPDNIFICNGVVKFIDFGLSICNDRSAPEFAYNTNRHSAAGTEGYVAPEIIEMKSNPDYYKADIYSVGKTLISIVNCELHSKHSISDTIFKRDLNMNAYDTHLIDLINQCISHDPSSRPSAEDACTLLNNLV